MSEKNGQGQEKQWSKGSVVAALTHKQQQGLQSGYNASASTVELALPTPVNALFSGSSSHIASGSGLHGVIPYASARFQAPPIDHHVSTSTIVTQTSSGNVPVPSGFVPPPFPSSSAAAGATSVLTPNPFAVSSLTSQNAILPVPNSSMNTSSTSNQQLGTTVIPQSHGHYTMDQFQHLNAQQHFELSKLMAATFGTNQIHGHASVPSNFTSSTVSNLPTAAAASTSNIHSETQTVGSGRSQQNQHSQQSIAGAAEEAANNSSNSGAINNLLAEQVIGAISSGSNAAKLAVTPIHGRLMGLGIQTADDEKIKRIQQLVESGVSENAKQQIVQILDRISTLRPVEKLLLYLRLPGEQPETDPLRQPQNPLGTRSEINHTINWVRTHLEQDPQVSIPKQDVYNDYLVFCDRLDIKPLSTADFGKVMKQVFPGIRPRRLGTRGHSRYCYAAMRKTSKLPTPTLPILNTTITKSTNTSTSDANKSSTFDFEEETDKTLCDNFDDADSSWKVVKHWAESKLHVKINNLQDLAKYVKANALGSIAGIGSHNQAFTGGTNKQGNVTNKKYTQREPKEKRVMADMGPLKKRRKKKRKGSSSSESSCNPPLNVIAETQQQPMAVVSQLSPANSSKSSSQNILSPAIEDAQKSMNLVNIKQEYIDSPGPQEPIDNKQISQYHVQFNQLQQQTMPINLAADTKSSIGCGIPSNRIASATTVTSSAFEHVSNTQQNTTAAVKNLTPKIMELSVQNNLLSSTTPSQTVIKEEIVPEDYNTSNIFCKKVRKAQQTKGFWVNSPTLPSRMTPSSGSLPIITTTASTPPPTPASVITSPPSNNNSSSTATTNYSMGPPTQMAPSTSPNNQTIQDDLLAGQPRVLSRNLQQLRAKKLMAAAAAAAAGTGNCDPPDAADLPENLGLPRERVISICNMDKHELDDYLLANEEENSEDQETELLQYFQMGDAEEKLLKNSSSDAKRISDPTVPAQIPSSSSIYLDTATSTTTSAISSTTVTRTITSAQINPNRADRVAKNDIYNGKPCQQLSQQALNYLKNHSYPSLVQNKEQSSNVKTTSKTALVFTVGTASASLEQIAQKHQKQNQQQGLQKYSSQPQPPSVGKVSNKRKINLNSSSSSDITAARKNYSFLPISPNINSTSSCTSAKNDASFFASPGFSRLLTKQQSLDCESSCDPMIGATRRRRTFMSMMSSASAPPSPSLLKQQQETHILGLSQNFALDQWPSSNPSYNNNSAIINASNALLGENNSLDLDLFAGEASTSTAGNTTGTGSQFHRSSNNFGSLAVNNSSENNINNHADAGLLNDLTQRSRSVPLSQLQRSLSPSFNRTFHTGPSNVSTVYSACNSLAQTPVPTEFIDSVTLLSENSCSQHSASIKLEEVGNVVGSDSTVLLDEVDVSDILSSPDFVAKFSSIAHASGGGNGGSKTTCSSAGSSSGYSSAGHFSLSLSNYGNSSNSIGGGTVMATTVSRSVPSTPLPHQNPGGLIGSLNCNSGSYRKRFPNNCNAISGTCETFQTVSQKCGYGSISSALSRSACDVSKSMPSTPITTTPSNFRYSPSEYTRDFLINGNTIDDSITTSFGAVTNDNLIGSDVVGLDTSLLTDEDCIVKGPTASETITRDVMGDRGVITPDFTVQSDSSGYTIGTSCAIVGSTVSGGESSPVVIGVGTDILDNL